MATFVRISQVWLDVESVQSVYPYESCGVFGVGGLMEGGGVVEFLTDEGASFTFDTFEKAQSKAMQIMDDIDDEHPDSEMLVDEDDEESAEDGDGGGDDE